MRCWNWAARPPPYATTPRGSLGGLDIGPLDRLMGIRPAPSAHGPASGAAPAGARGGRAGGVRPRGHGHRQRSGWPGRRALRGRRALEPGPGHRRGRTYVLGGAGPCGGRQRAGLSRLRQLDRRGRKLARPGGRRLDPRLLGAWRARRHRGAGAAQGLLGGAGADAGAGAGLGGRRAGRRVAQVRRQPERWPIPSARSSMPRRLGPCA